MSAIRFKAILTRQLDRLFDRVAELVRDCFFYKTESSAGTGLLSPASLTAGVKALVAAYRSGDIDGSSVQVGDERLLIRARELQDVPMPGAGDYLIEVLTGLRREVIAARLDPTGTFWTIQGRRSYGEDWGDLSVFTLAEDWGDLTGATLFEDWQS
ncbi:hypothetical protein GC207_12870 [bacterium]|nr:hypothetical protein [bacterium]